MMRKILAAAVAAIFVGLSGAASAQTVVSPGCAALSPQYPANILGKSIVIDENGRTCSASTSSGTAAAPYPFTSLTPMQSGLAIASSTALTVPAGSTYAVVCARGQNVNFSTDGTTTPTASVGMQLIQNQCVSLQGATILSNFRAIQQAATATLDVSYYK